MAVVLAFRALVVLTPLVGRRVLSGPVGAEGQAPTYGREMWRRLTDPAESDEALSADLTTQSGTLHEVTTYSDTFELRQAQVRWGRNSGAAAGTDDAVTTHTFIKLSGGSPSDAWVAGDFTAVEAALLAFWGAIKENWNTTYSLKQVRWYKRGPAVVPPQAPVRIIDPAVAGTSVSYAAAPQCAVTVTEKTSDPRAWGRFYLPPPSAAAANWTTGGRLSTALMTDIADAADTMYQAWLAASCPAVVYSTAKPARETAGGGELEATVARALTVDQIQVDDLADVIRSRRFTEPLLRLQRDIA